MLSFVTLLCINHRGRKWHLTPTLLNVFLPDDYYSFLNWGENDVQNIPSQSYNFFLKYLSSLLANKLLNEIFWNSLLSIHVVSKFIVILRHLYTFILLYLLKDKNTWALLLLFKSCFNCLLITDDELGPPV